MKTLCLSILITLVAFVQALAGAVGPRVTETEHEFFAWGDFNGNGIRDFVVIDRATGALRVAIGSRRHGFASLQANASGIPDITDVAVGRFLSEEADSTEALALVSPMANRCNIMNVHSNTPTSVFFDGVGPRFVTAVDLPGGLAHRTDLVGVTVFNIDRIHMPPAPPLFSHIRTYLRTTTPFFTQLKTDGTSFKQVRSVSLRLDAGLPLMYARLSHYPDPKTVSIFVHDTREDWVPILTSLEGFHPDTRVVFAPFQPNSTRSVLVFHTPGAAEVQMALLSEALQLQPPSTIALGVSIERLFTVESLDTYYLAGIDPEGRRIHLFSFDRTGDLLLSHTLTAPVGRVFTAALPLEDGGLLALSGDPATGHSVALTPYAPVGTNPFARGTTHALAPLEADSMYADILLFDGKPLEDNDPRLAGRLHAGGWTSQLNDDPAFPGHVTAQKEIFRSPVEGLGDPAFTAVGSVPHGVRHGLANQIAADMSVVSMEPASGFLADYIQVDPPGGFHPAAITMTLSATDPDTVIHYSRDTLDDWSTYYIPVTPIMEDTTIYFFGTRAGSNHTPIQSVRYTFPENPAEMDADDDGVPDFVEAHLGLDPIDSGPDADIDGVSDLLEILAGTNPLDDTDYPSDAELRAFTRRFHFTVTPYSHPGMPHTEPYEEVPSLDHWARLNGTLLSLYQPDGSLEREDYTTERFGSEGDPQMRVRNHSVRGQPLYFVAGTPNRFSIDVPDENRLRGRGIYGLLTYDAVPLGEFAFTPNPEDSPADQAEAWIAAARAHYLENSLIEITADIRLETSVDLLLLEHCLGQIFYQRGDIPTPRLTLTPFRGDMGLARWSGIGRRPFLYDRYPVNDDLLATLPHGGGVDPGYLWNDLVAFIRAGVIEPGFTNEDLMAVAREIHRIGSLPMDPDNPIQTAPFDALRHFIDEGTIHEDYAPAYALHPKVAQTAVTFVEALPDALPTRDYLGDGILLVWEDAPPAEGMPVMTGWHDKRAYLLADAAGRPFRLPSAFHLLPGVRFYATGHLEEDKPGRRLLVDHIVLVDAPMPVGTDSVGSLLTDAWESFHFGYLGVDAFRDHDGDGYSTLQEFFENTDPHNPAARPAVAAVDLSPPTLHLHSPAFGEFHIGFQWSPLYQDRIAFSLHAGEDLEVFLRLEPTHPPSSSGEFLFHDIPGETSSIFYRVSMELR